MKVSLFTVSLHNNSWFGFIEHLSTTNMDLEGLGESTFTGQRQQAMKQGSTSYTMHASAHGLQAVHGVEEGVCWELGGTP